MQLHRGGSPEQVSGYLKKAPTSLIECGPSSSSQYDLVLPEAPFRLSLFLSLQVSLKPNTALILRVVTILPYNSIRQLWLWSVL